MNADAVPLLEIFEKKMRLEVPLFQRQYVWNREQQWEPLWEDIARKFSEYLEGRKDAPVHFLGAMVLDQKQTPTTHVEKRQIIDGQQRLITLQIILAGYRDFCRAANCEDLAKEIETFTLNKGMMADPKVDQFKVWPTQLDRTQFSDVISSGSREEIERRYPLVRRKYARKPDARARMVEGYLFFCQQLNGFFIGDGAEPPLCGNQPLPDRLEECFQALRNALQVVVIDLDKDDDAQVIFETLNARGEPLLPADLLRNFIFLRAARQGESQEELYDAYWRRFDDPFWRQEVRQGRLNRPRSDLFMQHFLASRQTTDIPIKHLFVEYKYWIERSRPFNSVRDELATLARQGDDFRRLIEPTKHDPLFRLGSFLRMFDISTAYPFLLALLAVEPPVPDLQDTSKILESYLLRRAVCGLTTKNYNRIFLQMTRALQRQSPPAVFVRGYLSRLTGESGEWPNDEQFRTAWSERHAYQTLDNPKIVYILRNLNDSYLEAKHEKLTIEGPLTVEHILPQDWIAHWPLKDGSRGISPRELLDAKQEDPQAEATRRRNALLQTFGNLTIVTQSLNASASNGPWREKKRELLKSLLPINHRLHDVEVWDEASVQSRGEELCKRALAIWPRDTF